MRIKTPITMLAVLFLAPLAFEPQDPRARPASQQSDKPQPQPQTEQPRPALVVRRNPAAGTWKAEDVAYPPWTLTLAVDEGKVTGTVSQASTDLRRGRRTDWTGPVAIYDGFIERDTVSFKCNSPDGDRTMLFTGKIDGNEVVFTREVKLRPGGNPGDDGIFGLGGATHFTATKAPQPREAQPADSEPTKPAPEPSTKKRVREPSPPTEPSSTPASGTSDAVYDPFHAAQDMEVGKFYMHKGDADAAIDRFKHAITLKPNFAEPRMLLGEIYEKKGDTPQAIRYYKEFLQILPEGPDSRKIRKRLEKLTKG